MISATYTVIDPGAVVIVALHTLVADVTVATLRQPDHLAEGAKTLSVEGLKQLHEANLVTLYDVRCVRSPYLIENAKVDQKNCHGYHEADIFLQCDGN